jgi:hypothetical protein
MNKSGLVPSVMGFMIYTGLNLILKIKNPAHGRVSFFKRCPDTALFSS